MGLFQKSILDKYIGSLDKEALTLGWEKFKNHFHSKEIQENIRNSKEEQYQEGFFRDLFVHILGYTLNPNAGFNLTTEKKNAKGSKKADGAIIIGEKIIGVIELKGTNTTDLTNVEQQAFGYMNNQEGCVYVITSNFEKLRFYIGNAIEHIEFNLFSLTEQEFKVLFLCLSYRSIESAIPKKIKEESLSQEDTITKKLYKDYSLFKRELYSNLIELNPSYDKLLLFKKSQKLLDRFLFILFGEDRNLLPPNSVRDILKQWNDLRDLDEYKPLYSRYQKYFSYLNTGFKGKYHNIFAYNGGLFKPDEVLDNILINDDILYLHTLKLSEYDFDSEIDVNILGHIFENSLNELDEIKSQLEGQEIEKNKTKRKKDGVFYTPKYITKYIVENTVGHLCNEKKIELSINEDDYFSDRKQIKATKEKHLNKLKVYRDWLLHITIIDPACGSGAFLNEALNFLIEEHSYIDELETKLLGGSIQFQSYENFILENNLFGVDINEESVEIAKLSLWLRTAQPNRKLNNLNQNIKCGNSLIDDISVAGEKAFDWQKEFPQVFYNGGFDIVIGNPPYVQVNDSDYFNYETQKCSDLYAYFFEKGLTILKPSGYFSYITPSLFIKGMKFDSLRNYILNNTTILEISDKGDKVFEEVQMPTAITILCNNKKVGQIWNCFLPNNIIIDKINNNSIQLNGISKIMRGLEIGKDKVLDEKDEIQFLTGEDIYRYGVKHISYIDKNIYNEYKKDNYYFTGKRVIIRETGNRLTSIYLDDLITQQNRSLYSIKILDENIYHPLYILSLINSNIIQFYYQSRFAADTDIFPKIRIGQVKELPIKQIPLDNQKPYIDKVDFMLGLNKELQELINSFIRSLERRFEGFELSNKLKDWYLLEYKEFVKELGKKKIQLTLSQEAEWEGYFNAEKVKALEIKNKIDLTDKEIDKMVYELYGLNEEEIAIIEGE
ncbi:MAG: restriction endonuclease subunit [Bacteroidetes bacterium]|nr:restriction endonuclease subunit [Bacteroidota bacterium]